MKNIYSILIALLICITSAFGQGTPGFFELTVTDMPGATNNRAVVKMRAVNTVVPALSLCGDPFPLNNFTTGIFFGLKWPRSSGILTVSVNVSNNTPGQCPDNDVPTAGFQMGANTGILRTADSLYFVRGFDGSTGNPSPIPLSWVLNQWMTICTLTITGGTCSVCEDLNIYAIGENPEVEVGIEIAPIFSFNQTGSNLVDYQALPNNAPLPLNLLSFTAVKSGTRDALLTWTTANEENTSHFQIQRSLDKKSWYDAGSISAAGFSIDIKNYSFLDYQVYNGLDRRFTVYYRLKMVDLDGRKTLSPIQSVVYGADANKGREFVIYPNPASDGLQVEWDAQRDVQPTALEFFDIAGKLVYSQVVSDNTNQEYVDFSKSTIQPGLYLLRILNGDEPLDYKQVVVGQR